MKTIRLVIALLLLTAFSTARADVVIYRVKQTGRFIGSSNEITLKGKGFTIIDPDTRQGYNIATTIVQGNKIYQTQTFTNTRIYHINGAKGKTYTAFASSLFEMGRDKNQFSTGRNSPLAITPSRTISLPKAIVGASSTVFFDDPDDAVLLDGKATATYSAADTRTANNAGETLDQTFQRIINDLKAQGYQEFSL